MTRRGSEKGVALLSVMLVVTIASVLSAQLMRQTSTALITARHAEQHTQAFWYSRAGETLGRQILNEDLLDSQKRLQANSDSFQDNWAERFHDFELDDGTLNITIIDLRSRINLNALQGEAAINTERALREIWSQQNLPASQLEIMLSHVSTNGFHDISELAGLLDLNQHTLNQLRSLIVALPDQQLATNLNTANEHVLRALLPEESAQQIRKLIEMRTVSAFSSIDQLPVSNNGASSTKLDVKSEYFEIQAHAQFGSAHHYLRTRLHRNVDGEIRILDRAEGKQFVRELLEQNQS
ncbi:MAG: general secretion pathway protein GspK [Pseudomonadales bacterium]